MLRARALSRLWLFRTLIPAVGDYMILVAVLWASITLRYSIQMQPGLIPAFLPLFGIFLIAFYTIGLYELRRVRDFVSLISALLVSGGVCAVLGTFYFYLLFPYLLETPKTYLILTIVLSHVAMLVWRRAILAVTEFSLMRMRLLVLASEEHLAHLRQANGGDGLDLAANLGPDVEIVVADSAWIEEHWDQAKLVFSGAIEQGTPIVSLDRFYESMFGKVSPHYASDPSWALEHVLPRADGLYFKSRRLFDLVVSLLGLIILAPILASTAIMIKVIDRMPPFYGQRRVGYLGREFVLWKFRTMRPDTDAGGAFAPISQGLITRLGGFLRRFRLDEFPQLWNVVRGDMSLVGPRPEWVKEVEILEKLVPNYHLRHLVPPGITGWAQVYFRATNDPQDSIEKHHFDLYYLKHFSPALDLSILLKTAKRVFVTDARISSVKTPFPRLIARTNASVFDIASIISRN